MNLDYKSRIRLKVFVTELNISIQYLGQLKTRMKSKGIIQSIQNRINKMARLKSRLLNFESHQENDHPIPKSRLYTFQCWYNCRKLSSYTVSVVKRHLLAGDQTLIKHIIYLLDESNSPDVMKIFELDSISDSALS